MYEIRPESIKTYIKDENIKLPRFQRKQTWDDKKNFKLCVSIFKEYPIGVSILSIERYNNKTTRWLLDGRQRRNALLKMDEDPENVYLWAKKFIGFKDKMQPQEVEEKFWNKINEYLELDSETEEIDVEEVIENEDEQTNELDDETTYEDDVESELSKNGLDLLLQIILLVHNKSNKYSGFSKPFDFTKYIEGLPYIESKKGKETLVSKKIKSFINEYKIYCKDNDIDYDLEKSFLDFLLQRFRISDKSEPKLQIEVSRNWNKILHRIELLEKIDNILFHAKIGLIEVKNIKTSDGQKIFNIINSEGTQLTAVEILSAKPSWNTIVPSPNPELSTLSKELYQTIGIKNDNVVRWDIPATLVDRLQGSDLIFKSLSNERSTDFEKKLTLGFKILSGFYIEGIRKEDINSLSFTDKINWELGVESLIADLNTYLKLLADTDYFKFLKSWKISIMDLLSDAVAINFLLITFKDWERKGKTIGSNNSVKQFQKNCVILLDRLIFEYVTKQWRGSSDSKIAQNIKELPSQPTIFVPIEKSRWVELLTEIFDKNTITDSEISQKLLTPILYHFYCISEIAGPDSNLYTIEVDHIIPKTLFESSTIQNGKIIQENLFNLGLLPKKDNISKSNKKLVQIDNPWLKEQIKKYEFIEEVEYSKFSSITGLNDLKAKRRSYFEKAFKSKRDNLLA